MNEKTINEYMCEVFSQCRMAGIPVSDSVDSKIIINRRAKSRFAACKKEKIYNKITYRIEVGEAILTVENPVIIKSILAHELLHTCPGCYNHGETWKTYAEKMNFLYGYHIKRVSTYEEMGISAPERKKQVKYVIICQKCGAKTYRQKKSKLITDTKHYRCKCGGKLNCYKVSGNEDI